MKKYVIFIFIFLLPAFAAARECPPELKPIESLNLERCAGTWYEIARITHWYESGAAGLEASYELLPNGTMDIFNTWHKGSLAGKRKTARGIGKVSDKRTNARLKACFFWPFYSEFLVLEVGKYNEYLVLGASDRESLWIFSRQPTMEPKTYSGILERLKAQFYDISRIEKSQQ
jgi:apolipoprotein D and lipocalin family protein